METQSPYAKYPTVMAGDSKHAKIQMPEKIVTKIISNLPVNTVFQSQCLSKSFSCITENPDFIDMHLQQSGQLRPSIIVSKWYGVSLIQSCGRDSDITVKEVPLHQFIDWPNSHLKMIEMVGSCNGLAFVFSKLTDSCFLWNPSTRQCKSFPSPNGIPDLMVSSVSWGFGYCTESRQYKMVRIALCNDYSDLIFNLNNPVKSKFVAEVFSYGTDRKWRRLDFSKVDKMCNRRGITVKGVVYWKLNGKELLSFDLMKEEFARILCPVSIELAVILEFRESLAMSVRSDANENAFDVWVLRDGISWEMAFTTDELSPYTVPLRFLNDHQLLVYKSDNSNDEYSFSLYDMKCKEIKQIPLALAHDNFEVHNFVESIVPLYGSDDDSSNGSCDKIYEYNEDDDENSRDCDDDDEDEYNSYEDDGDEEAVDYYDDDVADCEQDDADGENVINLGVGTPKRNVGRDERLAALRERYAQENEERRVTAEKKIAMMNRFADLEQQRVTLKQSRHEFEIRQHDHKIMQMDVSGMDEATATYWMEMKRQILSRTSRGP